MNSTRRYQLLYFVFYASFSGFVAFRNVLLEEMGMTGVQIGLVGSLWVLGGVVAQPGWGFVADYTQSPKRVLVVAAALSGVAILSYPFGASVSSTLAIVAVGTVAYSATRAPIVPISNSLVLRDGFDYGYVRSFGSMAFGGSILVVGFALSHFTTYLVVYVYVVGMCAFVALVLGLPDVEEGVLQRDLGAKTVTLFRTSQFQVVVLTAFLLGSVSTSGGAFFSVYMRAVGLGDGYTGVAWAVKTVMETVLFLYIGRTSLSYGSIVSLGGASFAAGYLALSFLPTLGPVLVANLSLGAGIALLYFALVNLAHDCAPEGLDSTAQTVLTSVGVGAGGAVGQAVTGWLVDAVGVQRMYLYLFGGALALTAAGLAVHSVVPDRDTSTA